MTKLLEFYPKVLVALRYHITKDDLISYTTPAGGLKPAEVLGKRLAFPSKTMLQNGFGEDYMGFHPLSESIARRGTSPVLQHMQRMAKANLAHAFVYLCQQLLTVAADPALHKDLPPNCNDYLKKLSGANKNTLADFEQVIKAATKKNKLMTLYLKNGGSIGGKSVNRMCVIRFPVMELLDGEDDNILGIELRKKRRQVISALMRLVMPMGDSPEEYSAGSNNRTAPYLHAFLQAYHKAASQLNRIINRYGAPMEMALPVFELYSEKDLAHFSDMYDQLPPLTGNEGGADENADEEEAVPDTKVKRSGAVDVYDLMESKEPPKPAATTAQASKPTVLTKPAGAEPGIEVGDLLKMMQPAPAPAYVQQQPVMVNNGYGQPTVQQQYDQYGRPVQQQQYNNQPIVPSWLGGNTNQQPQNTNPFAQAVSGHQQAQQPVNTGYAAQPNYGTQSYL